MCETLSLAFGTFRSAEVGDLQLRELVNHNNIIAMPVSADLFPDLFVPFTNTVTFNEAIIEAVEKTLTEKNGKVIPSQ